MQLPKLDGLRVTPGTRVLVRIDSNTPMQDGVITDDLRLTSVIPTIKSLQSRGAVVVLAGHLGRPTGVDQYQFSSAPEFSMEPVANRLSQLLDADVVLAPGIIGPAVKEVVSNATAGSLVMLENLRFDSGETTNSNQFTLGLVDLADAFVNEAFGASHRIHASIVGPPAFLPCAAGYLLEREVSELGQLLNDPAQPFVAILGGSKVSDKLGVIEALLNRCDTILVGGAMAFTFAAAIGGRVGNSLVETEMIETCSRLINTGRLEIPTDVIAASTMSNDAEVTICPIMAIPENMSGFDIGPATTAEFAHRIGEAKTVLWNGPMGVFELTSFANGTRGVTKAVAACSGHTVVGGGDSAAAVRQMGLADQIDHVSTGGGAALEFIELGDLPGLAALRDAPTSKQNF